MHIFHLIVSAVFLLSAVLFDPIEAARCRYRSVPEEAQRFVAPRDFDRSLTPSEMSDLRNLLTSLANRSLPGLWNMKGELERVGHRLDGIHPLRFLLTVLSDEELKGCFFRIRGRGWVWDDFQNGLVDSLQFENSLGNVTPEMISLFAYQLGLSAEPIDFYAERCQWKEMIAYLIRELPRPYSPSRYDM